MDAASIDVQFNAWLFAGAVAYGGAASSYARRNLWAVGTGGPFEVRRAGDSVVLLRDTKTLPDGDTASIVVMGNLAAGLLVIAPASGAAPVAVGVAVAVLPQGLPAYVLANTVVTFSHEEGS